MMTSEPAVTVHEVSMQEWAMLAFHAERAPKRVRVIVMPTVTAAVDDCAVGRTHIGRWIPLAVAIVSVAWWLI